MKTFLLYGMGGSYNHGAEAIAKATIKYLRENFPGCTVNLATHYKSQDIEFAVDADKIVERAAGDTYREIYAPTLDLITPETVCIHIGGDNYCYPKWERFALIHTEAKRRGAKSILWSASVDPADFTPEMLDVLRSHDMITARDNISFNTLKKEGFDDIIKVCDIAFSLVPEETPLPFSSDFCTVNLSPLVLRKNPVLLDAYRAAIRFILDNTSFCIALVAHCIQPVDNDEDALEKLLIPGEARVALVRGDKSAAKLKFIIGHSRFLITARTHAAIAAYSSGVPVLAIAYSSKAFGIAGDLSLADYTVNGAGINSPDALLPSVKKLMNDEKEIRETLRINLPKVLEDTIGGEVNKCLKLF
jgi:polysaccharide pyruvyl transferase WcaK-like protein